MPSRRKIGDPYQPAIEKVGPSRRNARRVSRLASTDLARLLGVSCCQAAINDETCPVDEGCLRHLPNSQQLKPQFTALALTALTAKWAAYNKGMPAAKLAATINADSLRQARAVEPALNALLTDLGFDSDDFWLIIAGCALRYRLTTTHQTARGNEVFKNLQCEIERLGSQNQSISVPLEADEDGYLDKECPDENCLFPFKIHRQDWIVRDEEVFCPSCHHAAPATSWYTRRQVEEAREYALNTVKSGINKAMREDAKESKRRQKRNSFLSITLEVCGGHDTGPFPGCCSGGNAAAHHVRILSVPVFLRWSGVFLPQLRKELRHSYLRADFANHSDRGPVGRNTPPNP